MHNDATEAALGLLGLTQPSSSPLKRKQSALTESNPDNSQSASSDSISCICGFTYDDGFSIGCDSCYRWCHAACFDIVETQVPEEWQCWVCRPRPVDRERAVRLQRTRYAQAQSAAQRRRQTSPGIERKPRRASAATVDGGANSKRKRRPSMNAGHQQLTEDEHVDIDEPWTHSYVPVETDVIPHAQTRDRLKRVARHWRGVTALERTALERTALERTTLERTAFEGSSSDSLSPYIQSTTPVVLPGTLPPPNTTLRPLPNSSFAHPFLSSHTNPSVRPPSYTLHTTHPVPSSSFVAPYTSTIIPSAAYLADPLNAYAHLGMPKPFVHLIGPPLDVALDARITGNQNRFVRSGCRPNAVLRPVICPLSKRSKQPLDGEPPPTQECGHKQEDETLSFGVFALRDLKANEEVVLGWEWDDGSVIHYLPALIESPHLFPPAQFQHLHHQLTSMLHALSSTFATCACGAQSRDCALTRMAEFVDNRTPPTPSPSPPNHSKWTQHDRRRRKEQGGSVDDFAHVNDQERDGREEDGHDEREVEERKKVDLGPLVGVERGFRTRERVPMSGGMSGVEFVPSSSSVFHAQYSSEHSHPGPSRPRANGPGDRSPSSSRRVVSLPELVSPTLAASMRDRKGKGKAVDFEQEMSPPRIKSKERDSAEINKPFRRKRNQCVDNDISHVPTADSAMDVDEDGGVVKEERLPPKMRKREIHKRSEVLKDARRHRSPIVMTSEDSTHSPESEHQADTPKMDIDDPPFDPKDMPPPPLPRFPSMSPSAATSPLRIAKILSPDPGPISPSSAFANLSLLSPSLSAPLSSGLSGIRNDALPYTLPDNLPRSDRLLDPISLHTDHKRPEPLIDVLKPPLTRDDMVVDTPVSPTPASDPSNLTVPPIDTPVAAAGSSDVSSIQPTQKSVEPISIPARPHTPVPSTTTAIPVLDAGHVTANSPAALSSPDFNPAAEMQPSSVTAHSFVPGLVTEPAATPIMPITPKSPTPVPQSLTSAIPTPVPKSPTPPPTKVKLSLKDFALRKKKQREEMVKDNVSLQPPSSVLTESSQQPSEATNAQSQTVTVTEDTSTSFVGDTSSLDTIPADVASENTVAIDSRGTHSPQRNQDDKPPVFSNSEKGDECSARDIIPATLPHSIHTKIEMIEEEAIPVAKVTASNEQLSMTRTNYAFELEPLSMSGPSKHEGLIHSAVADVSRSMVSRQISQEDGEIISSSSYKSPPLAPRSHTPPTHPRSFHAGSLSLSAAPRRRPPLQQSSYRSKLQNIPPPVSRPLPNAPRALRTAMHSNYAAPPPAALTNGGPSSAPRGPSADRDRERGDWDRERTWIPTRGRSRGSGWSR